MLYTHDIVSSARWAAQYQYCDRFEEWCDNPSSEKVTWHMFIHDWQIFTQFEKHQN